MLHRGEELPFTSALPGTNDPTPALPQGTHDFSAIKSPADSAVDFSKQRQSMYYLSLTLSLQLKALPSIFLFCFCLYHYPRITLSLIEPARAKGKENLRHTWYKSCHSLCKRPSFHKSFKCWTVLALGILLEGKHANSFCFYTSTQVSTYKKHQTLAVSPTSFSTPLPQKKFLKQNTID